MNELKQKQWPEFKNFSIEEKGLRVESKTEGQFFNTLIDFEQIGSKEVIINKTVSIYGIIAILSIFFNIIFLIVYLIDSGISNSTIQSFSTAFLVGFTMWARLLFKISKLKVIQGQQSVSFFYPKKEMAKVDAFIKELQNRKVEFLRKKYMVIDKYTPEESLKSQFLWLKSNEYISDLELEILMEELKNRKLFNGE